MRRSNITTTFIVIVVLSMACSTALAREVLPGSILHLDAGEQNARDKTWKNLGLAGGEIPTAMGDQTPQLRNGDIRIPEIGFSLKTKWYTARGVGQAFASTPRSNCRPKIHGLDRRVSNEAQRREVARTCGCL